MFRELLYHRLIQAGLAFFVIVVGGSLLYSWHAQRITEGEMARHARFLQGRQKQNEAVKNIELIDRVLVKLWQQGDRGIVGGSAHNGKVYPHYDNVIYVEWKKSLLPNGDPYLSVSSTLTEAEESLTPEDIIRVGNRPSYQQCTCPVFCLHRRASITTLCYPH